MIVNKVRKLLGYPGQQPVYMDAPFKFFVWPRMEI
jgi:hypothetical protein